MTAKEKYKKGDRVRRRLTINECKELGVTEAYECGTVVGFSRRSPQFVRILRDGKKTPVTAFKLFWAVYEEQEFPQLIDRADLHDDTVIGDNIRTSTIVSKEEIPIAQLQHSESQESYSGPPTGFFRRMLHYVTTWVQSNPLR